MRNIKWPLAVLAGLTLALGGSAVSAVAAPTAPVGVVQGHSSPNNDDDDTAYVIHIHDHDHGHGGWRWGR
ncbi:hypothetical protein ABT288_40035 [Streptomyces sp. NPDC001093]|uniref:hypothetical protein n=1 Tax=Streptomyces TaxID=1883 RepID=UPI001E4EDFF8|nr:hypothetical protein [Streptomyces barringtoniae]MCC5480543.1 hypothetical protein [Streptomyces barringtoniae]